MLRPSPDLVVPSVADLRLRRSAKWHTHPADVLPLTVAEMDFGLAPPVAAALHEAIDRGDTGYASPVPGLGESLSAFASRRWGWPVDPASVVAVTDVGVGVVELLRALTAPGGAVVVSPPVYPPFFDWTREAGAHLVEAPLRHDDSGWHLDLTRLEEAFSAHPAVYVLCNPHNPVGRAHPPEELAALVQLAAAHGVTIVADEIHAPLVLSGAAFTPILTVPGAAEVAVSVLSASKGYNLAGLKCAAIIAASPAMNAVTHRLPPDGRWRVGHLGVIATTEAFTAGDAWLDQLLATLDRRRSQLGSLLEERLPSLRWDPPGATYLAWLDCREIGPDGEAHTRFLRDGRIALEAGRRFGAAFAGYVRLNFATSEEILDEATARMARALA